MPDKPTGPGVDGGKLDFSTAPGGDMDFDVLFPPEGSEPAPTPQAAEPGTPATPAPAEPPQATPAPVEPTDFLKAGQTIYKTREEAAQGIQHKDALIEQLRQQTIALTGVDPITRRPVGQPQAAPENQSYLQSPERLFDDVVKAAEKGDKRAYAQAYMQFMQDAFAPISPIISSVAKREAVDRTANEIPGFREFYGTPAYNETLDAVPVLKEAIQAAETNLNYNSRLPELYRAAFWTGQGRRTPEIARAAAQQAVTPTPAPVQTPPTARPTTSPSTMTPAPTQSGRPMTLDERMRSSEQRKALISEMESRGIGDFKF